MSHYKTSRAAAEPASPRASAETNPPQRILVVDDDIAIRQLSAEVLIRSGFHVDAAANGAAAWQALNSESYDLLITDQHVPDLNCVELLKKLRAARMSLPVIMSTRALPKEDFSRRPWLQPAATLLKPYTGAALLGTVKEVLRATGSAR
jgi:DNA-binding response OmpR family regulator